MDAVLEHLHHLLVRYPALEVCQEQIREAYYALETTVARDGLLLVCGNGGSSADGDHLVGELMKGFNHRRPMTVDQSMLFMNHIHDGGTDFVDNLQGAIRAISLSAHTALLTAYSNDCDPEFAFAQQVWGYGRRGDSIICISTSGNSRNVVRAAQVAKTIDMHVIGLTGQNGGRLGEVCDVTIRVPSSITLEVQEFHLPIYHALCLMLETRFFGD